MGIKSYHPTRNAQAQWETRARKELANAKGPAHVKASSPRVPRIAMMLRRPADTHAADPQRKTRITLPKISIQENPDAQRPE